MLIMLTLLENLPYSTIHYNKIECFECLLLFNRHLCSSTMALSFFCLACFLLAPHFNIMCSASFAPDETGTLRMSQVFFIFSSYVRPSDNWAEVTGAAGTGLHCYFASCRVRKEILWGLWSSTLIRSASRAGQMIVRTVMPHSGR